MRAMSNSELFDKVDEEDKVIGRVTRGQAHMDGHIHRSVMWFLFDEHKGIFVNQRAAKGKDFHPSYWSIVLGGHVLAGQSYRQALIKEADEEAAVRGVQPFYLSSFKKRFDKRDRENVEVYGFILDREPQLDPKEFEQGGFCCFAELDGKMKKHLFLPETKILYNILEENYEKIRDM